MPHIPLPDDPPGILGLLAYKPATGTKIAQLIHQLLRGASPLSPADRELIAAQVSRLNECEFCARSHTAAMRHLDHYAAGEATRLEPNVATSPKLAALLQLAAAVVPGGHHVTDDDITAARAAGNNDEEIHDTVLIAAAFCMLNRYVDGLGAITPHDDAAYDTMGAQMAAHGYLRAAPPGD
jgi:uncharacterized peroxidase-related enzyme